MVLSDASIINRIKDGMIQPSNLKNVQQCSYDFELARFAKTLDGKSVDLMEAELNPGDFILASTTELFDLPLDLCGEVKGKSSVGRLGIVIENAGHIDPGFRGNITLEVCNISGKPLSLKKFIDKPFGQIIFHQLDQPAMLSYSFTGHYQNQKGATVSWLGDEQ